MFIGDRLFSKKMPLKPFSVSYLISFFNKERGCYRNSEAAPFYCFLEYANLYMSDNAGKFGA